MRDDKERILRNRVLIRRYQELYDVSTLLEIGFNMKPMLDSIRNVVEEGYDESYEGEFTEVIHEEFVTSLRNYDLDKCFVPQRFLYHDMLEKIEARFDDDDEDQDDDMQIDLDSILADLLDELDGAEPTIEMVRDRYKEEYDRDISYEEIIKRLPDLKSDCENICDIYDKTNNNLEKGSEIPYGYYDEAARSGCVDLKPENIRMNVELREPTIEEVKAVARMLETQRIESIKRIVRDIEDKLINSESYSHVWATDVKPAFTVGTLSPSTNPCKDFQILTLTIKNK